jgi:hypothetical protein
MPDPSIAPWYKKAAAAREARRPVYRATAVPCGPPPADLAELAEKFRAAAARGRTSDVQPPVLACSTDDSFATANLSNNSLLESDFHDNSKILVPVSVAPPPPPPSPSPNVTVPGGFGNWSLDFLGSVGDETGIESMDTSKTQTALGAGYHQCKVARRGRVSKEVFDISVEKVGQNSQSNPTT